MSPSETGPLTDEEIGMQLLLEGVRLKYGYDFRGYSMAHVKRRLHHCLALSGQESFMALLGEILGDRQQFGRLLDELSINATEMFRDPSFYKTVRERVMPILKTHPFVKIWHAGCATGEEAYSMAITLREVGLGGRFRLYATDFNERVLDRAREGLLSLADMRAHTRNYIEGGGAATFSDYYTAAYDHALFQRSLRDDVVFAHHNLVTDASFGVMNMIVCRNVLIYFGEKLQEHTVELFAESLDPGGFLCLGMKESLARRQCAERFDVFDAVHRIYRLREEGRP